MGGRRRTRGAAGLVALLALTPSLTAPGAAAGDPLAPAPELAAPVVPCSAGLVALTFDDGPDDEVTDDLLDSLVGLDVPAVFFVVGRRVDRSPEVVLRTAGAGFAVANHSYAHEKLTRLTTKQVRRSLVKTRRSIRAAGVEPSPLMRPPYGARDERVDRVVADLGLVPVLWTVDPEDWKGDGATTIAERVLAALRPGRRNVVLLHDGITNSPATLAAVPRIVRKARAQGYCFAALDHEGEPTPPVPALTVVPAATTEPADAGTMRFVVTLDRPTSRPTGVRVRTVDGTATAGQDYQPVDQRLRFPAGSTRAVVQVPVLPDALDERRETLDLRLSDPRGLSLEDRSARGEVRDDDPPPAVSVGDRKVDEPVAGSAPARVRVRLSEVSGRQVLVRVATVPGTATEADFTLVDTTLRFRPGQAVRTVRIPVHADDEVEPAEHFTVAVVAVRRGTVGRERGTVTVLSLPVDTP